MRLALAFYSVLKMPIEDIIACSIAAEEAGFEYISMAESFYRDAAVLGTAIASRTVRVKFGSSIFPIHTRTPFQIAMAAATLNEYSNGRLGFIGLGSGYRSRIEKYFGITADNPLTKIKEHADVIRGLLSGSDFTYSGRFFRCEGFPSPASRPLNVPILFAASGDKMLQLAGQVADGIIMNSIGMPEYYRHALSVLRDGAKESGKDKRKHEVAASIIFSVADRHDDAIEAAKLDVLFYFQYPELDPVIAKTPYERRVSEIRKLSARGNSKQALSLVTDEMVETLAVAGTPKECRNKIRKLNDYGITIPVIRVSVQPFKEQERIRIFLKAIEALKDIPSTEKNNQ
jgi:5,10-methylenetetrahydromethanopterin reductase